MAEVTPIQTKDNSQLYTTAAAAGAGAAIGGVGGYLTKPFLKDGNLTDEFIKKAEENLTDDAKKVMANQSELLAKEAQGRELIHLLNLNEDISDAGVLKDMQQDAKNKIAVLESLPERIQKAKSFEGYIKELAAADKDLGRFFAHSAEQDLREVLTSVKDEIKQKHASDWSTDILRQVDNAKNADELIAAVKPYDNEIAQTIAKTCDPESTLKEIQADTIGLKSEIATETATLRRISEAKSFDELKTAANSLPDNSIANLIYRTNGDLETLNMTAAERLDYIKQMVKEGAEDAGAEAKVVEKILAAKDQKELGQIMENFLNDNVAREKHSLISGCWDSAKKEFVNTENALGESVKKTAGSMKTRAALIYGAIGAAVLGAIGYFASRKPEPTEAKVDTKA